MISYADPENLRQIGGLVELPTGHTRSCIEDCDYVWTGGPARRDDLRRPRAVRPAAAATGARSGVTDLRDLERPKVKP